jgi:CheY-like chemotaxis protein
VAENGLEAVELARDHTFDVILMDVQMPEMDGLEATRVIRREEAAFRRSRTPIIAMTAHAMPGDRERCLGAGMDGYVMKPIRADHLFRSIEEAPFVAPDAPTGGTSSAVNLATALASANGDDRLLRDIMRTFLSEGPLLLDQLQSAWRERRWNDAQRAAHTLKGGFLTFGAAQAADLAQALEIDAASGRPSDPVAAGNFLELARSVLSDLSRYLNSSDKSGNMTDRDRAVSAEK